MTKSGNCEGCGGDGYVYYDSGIPYSDNPQLSHLFTCLDCHGSGNREATIGTSVVDVTELEDGTPVTFTRVDGFRPRKVRPAGWEAEAMAAGIIRDPNAPPPPTPIRQPGDVVVQIPTATMRGSSAI